MLTATACCCKALCAIAATPNTSSLPYVTQLRSNESNERRSRLSAELAAARTLPAAGQSLFAAHHFRTQSHMYTHAHNVPVHQATADDQAVPEELCASTACQLLRDRAHISALQCLPPCWCSCNAISAPKTCTHMRLQACFASWPACISAHPTLTCTLLHRRPCLQQCATTQPGLALAAQQTPRCACRLLLGVRRISTHLRARTSLPTATPAAACAGCQSTAHGSPQSCRPCCTPCTRTR